MRAIFRYFVAEDQTICDAEIEVFEEVRNASEETDALDALGLGLIEKGADEQSPGSVSRGVATDDDGACLSEVLAVDVKRGAAEELLRHGFDNGEGVDVRADLRVTPGEQGSVVCEAVDELMNGARIPQLRSAGSHEGSCNLVFRFDEGDCDGGRGGRGLCYEGH